MNDLSRFTATGFLFLLCCTLASAQDRMGIYDLDAQAFPTMRAKLFAHDDAGNLIPGLRAQDITLSENGVPRTVTRLDCRAGILPEALSVAVSFDLSSSMQDWDVGRRRDVPFTLGQHALRYLARSIPMPYSELALQGFGSEFQGGIPLTRQRSEFLGEVNNLRYMFDNDFYLGLFHPQKGVVNVAKAGAHRRSVILITDIDACSGPAGPGYLQQYIDTCTKYSIRFYAIIFRASSAKTFIFQPLIDATGGRLFDMVTTQAEAEAAIREILAQEQGGGGCEIEWQSAPGCPQQRDVMVEIPDRSLSAQADYRAPDRAIPELQFEPAGLAFGPIAPGNNHSLNVTLTATQHPTTVESIDGIEPPFFIDGVTFPLTLQPWESRTLTIRFSPADSMLSFTQLRFNREGCSPLVYDLSGGVDPVSDGLRVMSPNGGEQLLAGSIARLEWTGIDAGEPVVLEYSIDRGKQWTTIVEDATGLAYDWLVPYTPGDSCLLRISRVGTSRASINFLDRSGRHVWCAFSPDGALIAVSNTDLSLSLRNASTGLEVRRLIGHSGSVRRIEFSPDGRYLLTASLDRTTRVWEVETGRLVHVLAGHGAFVYTAAFSPDGKRIVTCGTGRTIIWSLETGEILREFVDDPVTVEARFNHDGSRLVIRSSDVVVRDAFSGAEIHRIAVPTGSHHVEVSDDGSLLLVGTPASIDVYETSTWNRRASIVPSDGTENVMAHFRPGDQVVVTASRSKIEFWDPYSGYQLVELPTNGVGAANAALSGDRRRLVSVREENGTIWDLQGGAVEADVSDAVWSIILSDVPVADFTLSQESICAGDCIDLSGVPFSNALTWEWSFVGANPSSATGESPGSVCYPLAGRFPVQLIVTNETDRDTLIRFITVVEPPATPVIDRSCGILATTPATTYQWLRDGVTIDGATSRHYRYDGAGSYTVETAISEGCSARSAPFVIFDDEISSMSLVVGDIEAAPGEIVQVPVALRFSRPGSGNPWQLALRLQFNGSMLMPLEQTASPLTSGHRSIEVVIAGEMFRDTVLNIPFRVLLGDSPSTTLTLDTVPGASSCALELQTTPGQLRLAGLCTNGGVRLVGTSQASKLKAIRPNPVRGEVIIEYSLVESGSIDIGLSDLLGKRCATITSGLSTPGAYATTFDLSRLPSGRYLCVYTTPTERFTEVVIVE